MRKTFCHLSLLRAIRQATSPRRTPPTTTAAMLTIENFPHIAEAVVEAASVEALLVLRGVSCWLRELADVRLFAHLSHDLGSETTTMTLMPSQGLPMRVNLWSMPPEQRHLVRILEVHYGGYDDPNKLHQHEPGSVPVFDRNYKWKPDTAWVLPPLQGLDILVMHGRRHLVFQLVLKEQNVRTIIHPLYSSDIRKDMPMPGTEELAPPQAFMGGDLPADRWIIPLTLSPWDCQLAIDVLYSKPMRIDIVLLPSCTLSDPALAHEEVWLTYISLAESACIHTTDAHETVVEETGIILPPSPPAVFTFVGFESWNKTAPLQNGLKWEVSMYRYISRLVREDARSWDEAERQLQRVKFRTLVDWKREDVTEAEWDLISALDLS